MREPRVGDKIYVPKTKSTTQIRDFIYAGVGSHMTVNNSKTLPVGTKIAFTGYNSIVPPLPNGNGYFIGFLIEELTWDESKQMFIGKV